MPWDEITQRLRSTRTSRGASLRKVSRETGIHESQLHRYELGGRSDSLETWAKLSEWIGENIPDDLAIESAFGPEGCLDAVAKIIDDDEHLSESQKKALSALMAVAYQAYRQEAVERGREVPWVE